MKWVFTIAAAIAVIFNSSVVDAKTANRCAPSILAMTYNIRLDIASDGAADWAHRKDFLISQIAFLRPDILSMQEVLPNQRLDLEQAFPDYVFVGGGRDDGKLAGEASPLAIKRQLFTIEKQGTFWLSPTPDIPSLGWDAAYKRVVTWARLKRASDGQPLLVLSTHWDNEGKGARKASAALILRWIKANIGRHDRLILLGDFNAEVDEPSIAALLNDRLGLADSRSVASEGSVGPQISFNGFDAFPKSGGVIDHIFVGPGITVRRHSVIAQHIDGRVASDHFPVAALLDVCR